MDMACSPPAVEALSFSSHASTSAMLSSVSAEPLSLPRCATVGLQDDEHQHTAGRGFQVSRGKVTRSAYVAPRCAVPLRA